MVIDKNDNAMKLYLSTIFNKNINDITTEDMQRIETIVFSGITIQNRKNIPDYKILEYTPNINKINVKNVILSQKELDYITGKVKNIGLKESTFTDDIEYDSLENLMTLSLYGCYIDDYDKLLNSIENVKILDIQKPYDEQEIDIKRIPKKIEKLVLNYCIINNTSSFENLKDLTTLSLLGTELGNDDLTFLKFMPNLKELYISSKYKDNKTLKEISNIVNVNYDYRNLLFEKGEDSLKVK